MQVEFYDKGSQKKDEAKNEDRKTELQKNGNVICTPAQLHQRKIA
ncbi:hypothetical protein [uncultured Mailhella sp.]|nr:hypothetical protein [uncultured Mailhella sp.]